MQRDEKSSPFPSAEDVAKNIEAGLPTVDATRAKGLGQLGRVRDAKAQSLGREQLLLARKHGDPHHPRVLEAQKRFAVNENFRREIAIVHELSETPVPDVDKSSFVVHGFVRRRSDQAGIPGLTLALTDESGTWARELGYACTNSSGYFMLRVSLKAQSLRERAGQEEIKSSIGYSVEEAKREAEAKAAAAKRTEAAGIPAESTTGTNPIGGERDNPSYERDLQMQLRVFDPKGKVLHVEKRPVAIRAGGMDYRQILLGDDACDCNCQPPPEKAGGQPSSGPKVPSSGPNVPAAPAPAGMNPTGPHVSALKQYRQPTKEELASGNTPLEAIRGIGPKTATKLRQAGVDDVEEYQMTKGATFVKVAGFDKNPPKSAAPAPAKAPAQPTREAKPAAPAKPAAEAKAPVAREKAAEKTTRTAKPEIKKTIKKKDRG